LANVKVKTSKAKRGATERTPAADGKQREFEMVLIISPEAEGEKFDSVMEGITQLITGLGGEIDQVEQWGKRKLAYPIKGLMEGNYVLTRFKMEPSQNRQLEAKLRITEDVARHLLVRPNN
jgi:small subunit ribosomal protein S6